MTAWFLLSLVTGPVVSVHAYASNGAAGSSVLTRLIGWALSAFFAWRVTRGGRISRMLLILEAEGGLVSGVMGLAIHFRLTQLGVLAATAAQLALLLSPAVYRRTRPGAQPGAKMALWRRRTPVPLVTALAAGVALGLTGMAVSANGHPHAPALIIPAQDKADAVRSWKVSEAGFGLLLLGSLAGLAWPVRRTVAGDW
jgi:hypothetical protein